MMSDGPIPVTGGWWRFSEYEARDSPKAARVALGLRDHFRYIRPAPNASLTQFDVGIGPQDGGTEVDVDAIVKLDLNSEDEILKWCAKYGLLGILPEQASLIRLPARYEVPPGLPDSRILLRAQVVYAKTHIGWKGVDKTSIGPKSPVLELEPGETAEKYVEPEGLPPSLEASVLTTSALFSEEIIERGLAEGLGMYFPDVADEDRLSYDYPMPLSDRFWFEYGESLEKFRNAVTQFRRMLENLKDIWPLDSAPEEALRNLVFGRNQLHAILSARPALGLGGNGYEPKWAFSSLLAMFALASQMKLVGGEAVRQCQRLRCRRLFMTPVKTKRYCSERCRRSEEQARSRRK
jgi:hypothetical protein